MARTRPAVASRIREIRTKFDPFRVALFVLTVLTVSRIHEQFSVISKLRPALVMTVVAAAAAFARPDLVSRAKLLHTWPAKLMAAFAVLACVSTFFGISPGNSGVFILNVYIKTIVFAFLIIASIRSVKDLYLLVWAYVVSSAFLVYTAQFVFKVQSYGGYSRLANLDTYDANDLGLVLLVGLVMTILAFQAARSWSKIVCGVILVGIGASIAKSGSRGAFLGLLAIGIALLFMLSRVKVWKRLAFVAVIGTAMYLFAPTGYWTQMATLEDPKADYNWDSVNGRRQVAIRGIGYMIDYPFFGLGIHNFAKAECFISSKARHHVSNTGIRCTPPHNAYIEAGSETGIGGLALWLVMIPGGVISLLMLRRRLPRSWSQSGDAEERYLFLTAVYLPVALVGYSVGSFFLSFAWTDITYLIVATWAGLQLAVEDKLRRSGGGASAHPPLSAGASRARRALARA